MLVGLSYRCLLYVYTTCTHSISFHGVGVGVPLVVSLFCIRLLVLVVLGMDRNKTGL